MISFTDLIVADHSRSAQGRVHFMMLLANSEITGILPHTLLFESSEISIPPLSKP